MPRNAVTVPLPEGQGCEFPLTVTYEGSDLNSHQFKTEDGTVRILSAGLGNELTFTNAETGETLTFKSLGYRELLELNPDGSCTLTSSGTQALILFPTDDPAGPSTTLIRGRLVFDFTAAQVFTVQRITGNTTDVCAALS